MSMSANPTPEVPFEQLVESYRGQWENALRTWRSELSKVPREHLTCIPEPASSNVIEQRFARTVRSWVADGWKAELYSRLPEVIHRVGLIDSQQIKPGTINFKLDFTDQKKKAYKNKKDNPPCPPGSKIGLYLDITARTGGKHLSGSTVYRTSVWTRLPTNRVEDALASVRGDISKDLNGKKGYDSIMGGFDEFTSGDEWQWQGLGQTLAHRGFLTHFDYVIEPTGDTGYTIALTAHCWAWHYPSAMSFPFYRCYTGTSAELLDSFKVEGSSNLLEPLPSQSEDLMAFPEAGGSWAGPSGHDGEDLISF